MFRVGSGPTGASTCLALAVRYRHVWDTNRYYATLGIQPDATRREIREAYQRLNGDQSARLTYIVKQLLNPEIRRKYDETPLGHLFFDDEVASWIRRATVQDGIGQPEPDRAEEVGENDTTDCGESLDTPQPQVEAGQPDEVVGWEWSYYLVRSTSRNVDVLAQWQELLVSAFASRGVRIRVAVGFSRGVEPAWGVLDGTQAIVFLDDRERPTEALAQRVVSRVVNPAQAVRPDHEHGDKEMTGNFRRGADAAKEAAKHSGANFSRTTYFNIADGESAILRFLTESTDWIVVDQHQMVPTKAKPADYSADSRWPEKMGCVCRKDVAFDFGECYVCDFVVDGVKVKRATPRTWALACLREEVVEDGKVVGIKDVTREVTLPAKDGQPERTVTEKAIVVVNMGYKNFFSILEGFAGRYGTILDRDYWIKRSGESTATTYQIVPMDPIETEGGGRFDLREPEFAKRYESDLDLGEIVTDRASDDFYARFFDPRVTPSSDGKVEKTGAEATPPRQEPDVDPDRMSALAERVKGYGRAPAGAASGAPSGGGMKDYN